MKHRSTRFRAWILLSLVFALVASACAGAEPGDAPPQTIIVEVPGETVTEIVEVPVGGELITLVARCKATPPTEDGRCNNLMRAVPAANVELEAAGDDRRVVVRIIQDNTPWGDYKTEFELASAAGEAPDIMLSSHADIGTWAPAGLITDLTDRIGDHPEFDDILSTMWAPVELDGRRYAIVQDAEVRPMYWRMDLLAELGWTQAEIDSLPAKVSDGSFTWEDMFDTAEAAVKAGVVDPGNGWWHRPRNGPDFLYFYYAAGGEILGDGGALIFDTAAALKVYELMADAVARDILVDTRLDGDWPGWNTGVARGDVLFWFGGSWQWTDWAVNFVADRGGEEYLFENVGFGPIPALAAGTNTPITLTHPLVYMVSSATEHVDLALLVIAKATTTELNTEYALAAGKVAILYSQLVYEPYMAARFQSEMAPLLEFTTFLPNSPFFSAWSEAYYLGIVAVQSGEMTPEEAVALVVDQLQLDLGDNVIIE